jgi:pimeloyl-ACP methyl ester carboxylesterase
VAEPRSRHAIVLVHGAFHGPWCWEELIPRLEPRYSEGFDASHSPMLSQPDRLAEALGRVLARTPLEPGV